MFFSKWKGGWDSLTEATKKGGCTENDMFKYSFIFTLPLTWNLGFLFGASQANKSDGILLLGFTAFESGP